MAKLIDLKISFIWFEVSFLNLDWKSKRERAKKQLIRLALAEIYEPTQLRADY